MKNSLGITNVITGICFVIIGMLGYFWYKDIKLLIVSVSAALLFVGNGLLLLTQNKEVQVEATNRSRRVKIKPNKALLAAMSAVVVFMVIGYIVNSMDNNILEPPTKEVSTIDVEQPNVPIEEKPTEEKPLYRLLLDFWRTM